MNGLTLLCYLAALTHAAPTALQDLLSHRSIRPVSCPETDGPSPVAAANGTNATAGAFSSNWAGAVVTDRNVTSVTGVFTVPRTRTPTNSSRAVQYGAAAWVGIDGWTCGSAILQTGVSMTVQNGQTTYTAWYEWFPDYMREFSSLKVRAGDVIRATVEARSTVSGTAVLENLTTGRKARHFFRDASSLGKLCEANAEWIVEDFSVGGSLIPFADFGSVRFENASYVAAGKTRGVRGATVVNISQDNKVLTQCSKEGASVVECAYAG